MRPRLEAERFRPVDGNSSGVGEAFRPGAVPEVIDDVLFGPIVASVDEAVETLRRIARLDRARVRETFEKRFLVGRMCRDCMAIYRSPAGNKRFANL